MSAWTKTGLMDMHIQARELRSASEAFSSLQLIDFVFARLGSRLFYSVNTCAATSLIQYEWKTVNCRP
jgi:hypothetical protein